MSRLSRFVLICSFAALVLTACVSPTGEEEFVITFDPCDEGVIEAAPDTTTAEIRSVDEALAMWQSVAGVQWTSEEGSAGDDAVLPIRFEEAALAFYGIYEDERGTIAINRRLTDDSARAITIAHEIGHAFGLHHVSRDERISVMNQTNLTVEPTAEDARALIELWGPCLPRPADSVASAR